MRQSWSAYDGVGSSRDGALPIQFRLDVGRPTASDRRLRARRAEPDLAWPHDAQIVARGSGRISDQDKAYNIMWFTEQCLNNALRMEEYAGDAERDGDSELAEFFKRAQGESRKGAEQGKALLKARL